MSDKYDKAMEAIRELFGDTSASRRETIENLHSLVSECALLAEVLENDEARDEAS